MESKLDYLEKLGPGFITGVSDDDPSGTALMTLATLPLLANLRFSA